MPAPVRPPGLAALHLAPRCPTPQLPGGLSASDVDADILFALQPHSPEEIGAAAAGAGGGPAAALLDSGAGDVAMPPGAALRLPGAVSSASSAARLTSLPAPAGPGQASVTNVTNAGAAGGGTGSAAGERAALWRRISGVLGRMSADGGGDTSLRAGTAGSQVAGVRGAGGARSLRTPSPLPPFTPSPLPPLPPGAADASTRPAGGRTAAAAAAAYDAAANPLGSLPNSAFAAVQVRGAGPSRSTRPSSTSRTPCAVRVFPQPLRCTPTRAGSIAS